MKSAARRSFGVWTEKDERTGNWFVRWRELGLDGKLHKKSRLCSDYSDATTQKTNKLKELSDTPENGISLDTPLLTHFEKFMVDKHKLDHLRPSSLLLKRVSVEPFMESAPTLRHLTRENIVNYRDKLLEKLAPSTTGIRMREVKGFVRWLHFQQKVLATNVFQGIKLPKQEPVPHFLTDEQLFALDNQAEGTMKAIVRMSYLTGMRQNEVLQAKWEDIEWVIGFDPITKTACKRGHLIIWSTTAKNKRSRTIALRQEIVDLIGTRGRGFLFDGWDKHKLRYAWLQLKEKAQIKGRARWHDLRHTFCKLYLQGGGTIADLMSITGHQSIVMMQVYAHFENRYRTERMDAIRFPKPQDDDDNAAGQMAAVR